MSEYTESFNAGHLAVLEQLAAGAQLPQLLECIVRFIEAQADGMLCSILLLDADNRLRHGAAPTLPQLYTLAVDGSAIGPDAGSCGAAAARRERIVVSDIATHPNWTRFRHLALPHGLQACWSSPIFAPDGMVLGTFAMYYREIRTPSEQEIRWVDVATNLASIAILRDRAEQSLRDSEARARQLARLHAVSSGVNEAIVRVRDAQRLYEFACRLAVEAGFAQFAWVGLYDPASDDLNPVANYGAAGAYLEAINLNLTDVRLKGGPAARVVASGVPALANDIANDPTFFWKEEALRRGFKSCAVFPLQVGARVIGVFAIYAGRPHYFHAEEMRVLTALAADISFALESAGNESERRRMEAAVRAGEDLLEQIFSSVEDAIFYIGVDGPDRYRILLVNQPFLDLSGLREADLVGRPLEQVSTVSRRVVPYEKYRRAIETRDKVTWVDEHMAAGEVRHGEITLRPIFDATGRCTNFVGTVHDITAYKRAEAERARLEGELHHAQRLQSLGTLAGGIAHDFNNIVTAISSNIDLALSDCAGDAQLREYLAEVQKASSRARQLVSQILTFSRRELIKREVLDSRAVIEEACRLLQATLTPDIRLTARFEHELPVIYADATQIHQIVMNLGTNAVRALEGRGGVVEVSLDAIGVDNPAMYGGKLVRGRYLRLCVHDNGCGMDAATARRVFEPFFTTRTPGEGTGLGLSVVHGIVEEHGGLIDLQSEPGRGTVFAVYLPVHAPRAETRAPVDLTGETARPAAANCVREPRDLSPSSGPSGHLLPHAGEGKFERLEAAVPGQRLGTILYVDDDEALVFLARRALTRLGYTVIGHSDATSALQDFRARPHEFDVVVTDVSMPGLSGPDLAAELLQIRAEVPIVMVSGHIRREDRAAAQRLRLAEPILKPASVDEFARLVSKHVQARC